MSRVTTKGQATIPKDVRDYLGIIPGKSDVEFIIKNGRVEVITTNDQLNPFAAAKGLTKGKLYTDDIMEMTRG